MRTKFYLTITAILLTGCSINESTNVKSMLPKIDNPIIEHSYDELEEKHILWSEIFEQALDSYFVYFYSLNCDHCENMKNEVIEICLKRDDVFLVKSSNQVVLKNDVFYTIGVGNVGDFAILGYPSLVKIENKIVTKNVAGKSHILELLN